jgi:hypothetical protein
MQKLADTGCQVVCIAFSTNLRTYDDPDFTWGDANREMVTDDEIRHAIDLARENGMKVVMKPVVNCRDGVWRAWIRFYRPTTPEEQAAGVAGVENPWGDEPGFLEGMTRDDAKWDAWWNNYSGFLKHYAGIAAEKDVQLFCLGCEMNSTEEFEDHWRKLIAEVRAIYSGPITYDINHGRERELTWWDAVDVASISAYYQVPPPAGTTVEEAVLSTTPKSEIVATLEQMKHELAKLSTDINKKILFIETGVTNVRGCARYPWSHPNAFPDVPLDEIEQANYYAAMFETFWDEPWFLGFCWWDWPARLYPKDAAHRNRGFSIYGKQAEAVLREWYGKPSPQGRPAGE